MVNPHPNQFFQLETNGSHTALESPGVEKEENRDVITFDIPEEYIYTNYSYSGQ